MIPLTSRFARELFAVIKTNGETLPRSFVAEAFGLLLRIIRQKYGVARFGPFGFYQDEEDGYFYLQMELKDVPAESSYPIVWTEVDLKPEYRNAVLTAIEPFMTEALASYIG